MKIDILIDKLTPCLVEVSSGKICKTIFSLATNGDITGLAEKGWLFDWSDDELRKTNIYKLMIDGDNTVQGLVSAEVVRGAVYVHLVESAPHNIGENKKYKGVGGHLFAIAIKLSVANGFDGYIYFEAKNMKLVEHYSEMLGANRIMTRLHEYRMELLEENAHKIMDKYKLEGDLDVK
ncbi:MAG: hypothetical protein FWG90_12550 [Oscillospiraceae bacterium]|nr:hypothetical protein [Oscillospiraceae bacterium]